MIPARLRCVLVVADGPSRRVGAKGVLIGRQPDCDIVANDPSVSRRHALVRLTASGAEVVPLGRAPVEVNGKTSDRVHELANGDTITLPGLSLTVELHAQSVDASAMPMFRLERTRGGSFGIVHSPFVVGGGDTDDLIVKRWPAGALRFHVAQRELFVEVTTGKATRGGVEIEAGGMEPLQVDEHIVYRKEEFVVRHEAHHYAATTAVASMYDLPVKIVVEVLPRGGRVVFSIGDGERMVYMADRQLDLLIALLRPPEPFRAGEFVPDDVVRSIVWPRDPSVSRPEINMLISRCRKTLIEAGLSGPRLLVRAPGGGGTKLALAERAEIVMAS
ncbi:MAG: FHA domain-containing protein [Kofleriaceae bacterium]